MFELLRARKNHGFQAIRDIGSAQLPSPFRGFPLLDEKCCTKDCGACAEVCPTHAIQLKPLQIDLGRCIFCGDCVHECLSGAIEFSSQYRLGNMSRDGLVIPSALTPEHYQEEAIVARKEIRRLFGHSLKLRQVSAGGCNGCEMELAAAGNVNFDMGRFGFDFVASPRHADGLVITGPISSNMAPALVDAYNSVSQPRLVIVVGACAISGGVFVESDQLHRSFLDNVAIDLFIPGCPTHPLTFINALLDLLDRKKNRTARTS
ncbi:MAG: 4Fe-4S dicluster domain-containing protein [Candidatus Latescibacterota bacterium]